MARTYLERRSGTPLFSTERMVGKGMTNARTDVLLVQLFLIATLHSNKIFLGGDTVFTPPKTHSLSISGHWDSASAEYLARWERLRSEAKAAWSYGKQELAQFPGAVVPYKDGGMKIQVMNEMCRIFYGDDPHTQLKFPTTILPLELARELFWDAIYGAAGRESSPS